MKKTITAFVATCVALLFPGVTPAFDLGKVSVNGFISEAYIDASDNNFFDDTKDGSLEFNEIGLTLNSQLTEKLRVGAQFLSRDFGDEGDNEIMLDWGFADYRLRDWLGIRLGKAKLPIGLYNEGRDSDFLRPMAFLPQSIYDENKRTLLVAALGGHLYGNIPLGEAGDLDYQLFYGEIDFADDSGQARTLYMNADKITAAQNKKSGRNLIVSDFDINNKWVYGGSLNYNTPLDGLRFGLSLFEGKTEFDIERTNLDTSGTLNSKGTGRNKNFWVASVEYSLPNLTVAFEYSESEPTPNMLGVVINTATNQAWYGMLTWNITNKLSLSTAYDVFYADKNDHNGDAFVAKMKPRYLGWRKDFGIGIRYDINYHWLVKAEWHSVDGAGLGTSLYNPDGVERCWNYAILKTSINF